MYHSRIVLSVGGCVWYMIRNLRCTFTIDWVLANSKTQNSLLFTVNAIFLHDYPLAVVHGSTPRPLVQKKTWSDSLPIDMLPSAVSVFVFAQSSSEIPEGLTNNPVHYVLLSPQHAVNACFATVQFIELPQPSVLQSWWLSPKYHLLIRCLKILQTFFFRWSVHIDIHTVHSPTVAHLLKTLITVYIKIRWLLHISVYDHHQGACSWAWLNLYWY